MVERKELGLIDKLLPVWIIVCMAIGLLLGKYMPSFGEAASIGIPIGLFLMIYPAMTKIRMEDLKKALTGGKQAGIVVFFNYAVNPFLLWAFGYLFFILIFQNTGMISQEMAQSLWIGLILLGVAPCIAMVLVWTDLSYGNNALAITLMAWNSLIQMLTTPLYIALIIGAQIALDMWMIGQSVVLYLGLPLLLGYLTRKYLIRWKGQQWYDNRILPPLGKIQLLALLFTLIVMFSLEGDVIIQTPELILYMAVPLTLFFGVLFMVTFVTAKLFKCDYEDSVAIAFNSTGRNFELSIAIALTAFAAMPMVAVSTVIGPLIEVPVMLSLVYFARYAKYAWFEKKEIMVTQEGVTS
ncbi:hypothetical protein CUJ83_02925 [Methanocella sp. CWC-04]|uniref:Arsenite transporter, ACR3 family n=1 Tax=Methanooceanicella nereidis TaxID=2052831 RepID=A0AAP2RB67_9EURY|nr:arsenic resistance protein [Methanocella sp. CWC-04]MCD1293949.1 hypothetical protein [Methanocella sp. CWC-04]